jgi:hypothetical protein
MQETGRPMSFAELSKAVGFRVRRPRYLPDGYKLDSCRLYRCPYGCCPNSALVRYTDGLNSISIFEMGGDMSCMKSGSCCSSSSKGGSCVVQDGDKAGTVVISRNGIEFTIIADLSRSELRKIADSL